MLKSPLRPLSSYTGFLIIIFLLVLLFQVFPSNPCNAGEKNRSSPAGKKTQTGVPPAVLPSPVNGGDCILGAGNKSETSHPSKTNVIPQKKNEHKKTGVTKGKEPDKVMRAELSKAFSDRDYELVRKIVEANPELVKSVDDDGDPFLECAVNTRDVELARLFLFRGANPDVRLHKNGTLLMKECENQEDIDMAKLLLEYGASVNLKNDYGKTALHLAIYYDLNRIHKLELVKLLVSGGADVNSHSDKCSAPIIFASNLDDPEIAFLLIENGAKTNIVTSYGGTPLHYARNEKLAVYLLTAGLDPGAKDENGDTPLHNLATYFCSGCSPPGEDARRAKVGEMLVSAGASVNEKNNKGETPLHIAAREGSVQLTKFLVSAGAKVDAVDNKGEIPLVRGIQTNDPMKAYILISGYFRQNLILPVIILLLTGYGFFCLWRSYFRGRGEINLRNKHKENCKRESPNSCQVKPG